MNKFLVLLFLSTTISFAQSPWTKKEAEAYAQLSFTTINNYDRIFGNPDYFTEREIIDNTFQFYAEYGISNKTTILLNVPLKFIKTGDLLGNGSGISSSNSISSLGNIELGFKHKIYDLKWIISGQLNIEANTGFFDNSSGIRTGIDAWTLSPTINLGRSFKGFYTQAFAGISLRTNNYSSSFKIGGEVGAKPFKNFLTIGFIDIVKSFKNGNITLPVTNLLTALYINNQEYTSYGFKAIYEITENFGVNTGIGGSFSGNNVAKQAALTFGIYHKFDE